MYEMNLSFQNSLNSRLRAHMLNALAVAWLVTVSVLAGVGSARSTESVKKIDFATEVAIVTIPESYKIGHERSGIPGIIEMIPLGQKIGRWKDIFTIGTFPHSPEAPKDFAARAKAEFVETCGGKYVTADWDIGTHKGAPAFMWMQFCEKHKRGPSKGKPELNIILFLQGKEADLFLMRGFRYEASEHIGFWKDFLLQSFLESK